MLLGVGDGTFTIAGHYGVDYSPDSLAIGDLNGDQVLDLAVTSDLGSSVTVLLGVGDGTFAAPAFYFVPTANIPVDIAIGDLNGDQAPDLAVATSRGDNVFVLLGVGDGTFGTAISYAAGDKPSSLLIADLDGDQVLDMAVTIRGEIAPFDGHVSVLLGVGDGTFADPVFYFISIFGSPGALAIGDLDGDQVHDLAVANVGVDNVAVLLGVGDGTFGAAAHYAAGDRPSDIAIADLDGDQLLDLAVPNIFSYDISILFNQSGGACCRGAACSFVTEPDCLGSGGTFFGVKTTCDAPDADGDGLRDECDRCPADSNKVHPGICGCGTDDTNDSDDDGVPDCIDRCPGGDDRFDDDFDGVPDDCDVCPDSDDGAAGALGDADGDGVLNCNDLCPDVDDAEFAPECESTIPTTSQWGLIVLTLLLLAGGKRFFGIGAKRVARY